MNFIADGYVFEKYHQQRIVQIESNHTVSATLKARRQKEQLVFKKISTFFYRLSQLRKIRIHVSFDFDRNAFAPDGQLA
jgi:hypothetical protein